MKRLAGVIFFILILSGCFRNAQPAAKVSVPDTYLKAPMNNEDLNLDPSGEWLIANAKVFGALFDSLYRFGPAGEVVPGLAEALPVVSDDGLVYQISLRANARFHDDSVFPGGKGRSIIAQDVIYSLKRIADPANESGIWSLLQGRIEGFDEWRENIEKGNGSFDDPVVGLRVADDRTLEVRLTAPFAQITSVLGAAMFGVVPREAVEKYGTEFAHHPVGTGPFQLVSYAPRRIVVSRVSEHWRAPEGIPSEQMPSGIDFTYYDDDWNAFKDEKLDLFAIESRRLNAYFDKQFEIRKEVKEAGFSSFELQTPFRDFLIFNHRDSLMQNRDLRRAIAYAIPWREIIDPEDLLDASFVPATVVGGAAVSWEYSPEKARAALVRAGYPNGTGLPELLFRANANSYLRIGGMVEDALEAVGIPVAVEYNVADELGAAHLGIQGWVVDYPDAFAMFELLASRAVPPEGANYGYFQNGEFDTMLERAARLSAEELVAWYRQMDQWIHDNAIVVPFRRVRIFYALSPRITFVETDPLGFVRWETIRIAHE